MSHRIRRGISRRDFLLGGAATTASLTLPGWLAGCASRSVLPSAGPMTPGYFEEHFGVSEGLIRKVMGAALSRGGDFADLFFQHSSSTNLSLEDSVVNRASTSMDLGVGIRVVVGEQTGYAFSEELTEESMIGAARTAAGIAASQSISPPVQLEGRTHRQYYDTKYDWRTVGVGRVIPLLESLDERVRAADPAVARAQIYFSSSQRRFLVVDSEGRTSFDNRPTTRLIVSIVMEKNGERHSNRGSMAGRAGMELYTEERLSALLERALTRTRLLFDAVESPRGEMPVVLAAGSSGLLLHEAIGHGMEADFARKGTSIFAGRIGERVAEPFVTIVDDGTTPELRGAINFDDEGNESQRTVLVEDGILRGYMHDRISARHYGVESTGSGRRQSFRHMPIPRMRSTYMTAGPHARGEIVAGVKRGILAESFAGGQVKIGAGDYSFYVKNGWIIEDGKTTAPIKDVNIMGNGPETLSRITMVGDDFEMDFDGGTCGKDGQQVPVSLGMPTVLISSITVGGSKS